MTYYSMTPGSESDSCQTDLNFDRDSQQDPTHGLESLLYLHIAEYYINSDLLVQIEPTWYGTSKYDYQC